MATFRIVDDLIYEYASKWQDCIDDVVKDIILGEIAKPFDKFGIKEIHRWYRFETTVGVLLHWYSDVENDKFTLSELLNKLIKFWFNNEIFIIEKRPTLKPYNKILLKRNSPNGIWLVNSQFLINIYKYFLYKYYRIF